MLRLASLSRGLRLAAIAVATVFVSGASLLATSAADDVPVAINEFAINIGRFESEVRVSGSIIAWDGPGGTGIYVRNLNTGETRAIVGGATNYLRFWSPV